MTKKIRVSAKNWSKADSTAPKFKIGSRPIGDNKPVYIVAEIGINFDGSREKALALIDSSVEAGCDAVKFQIFKSSRMYSKNAGTYRIPTGEKIDITDLLDEVEIPREWYLDLKNNAEKSKIDFFASVCDERSADLFAKAEPVAYKVTSYEITHIPLIKHVSGKGLPFIISCGGATLQETEEAILTAQKAGQKEIVLMHCIAEYGVALNKLNLNVLKTLKYQFPEVVIGYSDHSADPVIAPVAAVALGAKMIEKHITLDRKSEGPDHSFALEPHHLKKMVKAIRTTEKKMKRGESIEVDSRVLGKSKRMTFPNEEYVRNFAYRLVYTTAEINPGDKFSRKNIAVLRSGENYKKYLNNGLHPRYFSVLLEKSYRATKKLKAGQAVTWSDILTR